MTISNDPSWSASRAGTFKGCRRQYMYSYYGAWEGWYKNADPFRRQCYILKNMTSLPMLIGSIVHDVIELQLKDFEALRDKTVDVETEKLVPYPNPETDRLYKTALLKLTKGFNQSLGTAWKDDPKKVIRLMEHHRGEDVTADVRDEFKRKTLNCLTNFCNLFPKLFPCHEKVEFLELEDFQSFELNSGEEVKVKLDLGVKINGQVLLLDWKTGKRNAAIEDQMSVYAMYAMKKFGFKINEIKCMPVYLDETPCKTEEMTITMKHVNNVLKTIRKDSAEMIPLHPAGLELDQSKFPVTKEKWRCNYCNFASICEDKP